MKLIQCLPTPLGPRSFVLQGLDPTVAYALADHAFANGGEAHVCEDGMRVNMREYMRKHARKKMAGLSPVDSVVKLRKI